MIRLAISVDGHTEETSVNEILAKDLRPMEVEPCPVRIGCARSAGRGNVVGGCFGIKRLVADMVLFALEFRRRNIASRLLRPSCQGERSVEEIQERPVQEK